VTDVSAYTGSPEIMDGRVKTLHPRVHGGILMRELDDDRAALASIGGAPIDLVVVNLYPFEETLRRAGRVARGPRREDRHRRPGDGARGGQEPRARRRGGRPRRTTRRCRRRSRPTGACPTPRGSPSRPRPSRTPRPTTARSRATSRASTDDGGRERFPRSLHLGFERAYALRYGENPTSRAAFYRERGAGEGTLGRAESLGSGGKELSFNNLVDVDAALEAVREHDGARRGGGEALQPLRRGQGDDARGVVPRRRDADAVSAFGGIVALNDVVDEATARALAETFLEVVAAPGLQRRGARRAAGPQEPPAARARPLAPGRAPGDGDEARERRHARAGPRRDRAGRGRRGRVVTKRAPTEEELRALTFAWAVCKHVKSNAIVLARGDGGRRSARWASAPGRCRG
jgi:phosphoribosylaminoimidazolecarboxamide formyltransferase/IMP cyclohydrolase